MHDPRAVANFFVARAKTEGRKDLNPAKLQELVYYAHGWHLGIFKRPLIGEPVLAAPDGPEILTLDRSLEGFGTRNIETRLRDVASDPDKTGKMMFETVEMDDSSKSLRVLEMTWKAYGKFSPYELAKITQKEGTPWYRVRHSNPGGMDTGAPPIPDKLMLAYFQKKAEQNRERIKKPNVEETNRIVVNKPSETRHPSK